MTTPLRQEKRNGEIWAAYLAGKTQAAIAREFGIQQPAVAKIIQRVIAEMPEEPRAVARMRDLDRIEALYEVHWPKALEGDGAAFNKIKWLIERRARMFGYDAPVKHELSTPSTSLTPAQEDLLRSVEEREGVTLTRTDTEPNPPSDAPQLPAPPDDSP